MRPDDPTDRMAADRVAGRSAPRRDPTRSDDLAEERVVYDPASGDPYVHDETSPPAELRVYEVRRRPAADPPHEPARSPDRARRAPSDQPPMDLRELRLRLTAEPAEGRVAGPPRVRPVRARRRTRRFAWGAVLGVGGGLVAITAAIAVAATWLPRLVTSLESVPPPASISGVP
jgi:hypothetical protein